MLDIQLDINIARTERPDVINAIKGYGSENENENTIQIFILKERICRL